MEIFSLIKKGDNSRAIASTKMNDNSSRSHAIFIIIFEQMTLVASTEDQQGNYKQLKFGKLNLVDLAGSERVRITVNLAI